MKFAKFISNRLSIKRSNGTEKPSPAVAVAICGVAVSIIVMMLSVAVVTGFKSNITKKIMGFNSQISIAPMPSYYSNDNAPVTLTHELQNVIDEALAECVGNTQKINQSLVTYQPGIIKKPDDFAGIIMRGYSEGYDWKFEQENMVEGTLPYVNADADDRTIVISTETARKLMLKLGDRIDMYFFNGSAVKQRKLTVAGIYRSDFSEFDNVVAYASYPLITKLANMQPSQGNELQINGLNPQKITSVATQLQAALNLACARSELSQVMTVSTIYNTGAAYFNWLAMLDTNVVVILILMACVSGFMLITCVLILILQRVQMIGLLKALGANNGQLRSIFMRLGLRITLTGMAIGNIVGLLIIGAQWKWHILPLDPENYYLSYVPVDLSFGAFMAINIGSLLLAMLMMTLPTAIMARLSPVKTLRFE